MTCSFLWVTKIAINFPLGKHFSWAITCEWKTEGKLGFRYHIFKEKLKEVILGQIFRLTSFLNNLLNFLRVILENMIGSTDKYEQNANTVSPSSHRKMYSLHIFCLPYDTVKPSKWPPGRPRGGRKNLRLPWLAVRICGISGDLSGGCRVYPVVGNQKRLSSPALCRRAARPNIVHRIYQQYKNMINSAKWRVVYFQSRPKIF